MEAKEILKNYLAELAADKKQLAEVDTLLKVQRDAGEPSAELEQMQRTTKARIEKWEKAIKANTK